MNPRQQAFDRLGGRYEVRVLEPSPPAVLSAPWWADDPAARGEVPPGRRVVTPTTAGDVTWDTLCAEDAELAAWCAPRWLGAWPRLDPAPERLMASRHAFHTLAEHVLAPARHRVNGKIGLRWTRGGFGTPFFGDDVQARVDGTELVVVEHGRDRRETITTVGAAALLVGVVPGAPGGVYSPSTAWEPDETLALDPLAVTFLAAWFGFCASVLEQLRAEAGPGDDPSRVQLWPEHFDLAFESGDEAGGRRAGFGGSPGDEDHPEPYLYVAPWTGQDVHPYWNAASFRGAELAYDELVEAADQRGAALSFLRWGRSLLQTGGS